MKYLIDIGADVNHTNSNGHKPLTLACQKKRGNYD